MVLDLDFVKGQFTQCSDYPDLVFASNAGGSYVCNQVNDLIEHYNRHTRVQPYSEFSPSSDAGLAMDRTKRLWADAFNVDQGELTIGPSSSANTYVMSHAIGHSWRVGDEIVVTNQDHETNIGAWRRKAEEKGVLIKEWQVDPESGLLSVDALQELLSDRTRWVFFTHCSNVVGTVNPVRAIVDLVAEHSAAKVFVDGVAYAPHHLPNLRDLGVDAYVFSLYKVFGPHQSILYTANAVQHDLQSQAHYFLQSDVTKYLNPAGPQHAQVAAASGVIDYFSAIYNHHFNDGDLALREQLEKIHTEISQQELSLTTPLLSYLADHPKIRVLGKRHADDGDRAPTIAFVSKAHSSAVLAASLQAMGIGTENGDFYARRLIEAVGIDADDGVVRLSLLHYNSVDEVDKIISCLDQVLAQ